MTKNTPYLVQGQHTEVITFIVNQITPGGKTCDHPHCDEPARHFIRAVFNSGHEYHAFYCGRRHPDILSALIDRVDAQETP